MANKEKVIRGPWLAPRDIYEPLQLNLFDNCLPIKNRYTFLDIEKENQNSLVWLLEEYEIRLLIDLRHFPVFARPNFYHKELLDLFSDCEISYVPIVYEAKYSMPLSKFRSRKDNFSKAIEKGSIAFLYGNERHTSRVLREWKIWMSKNFETSFEFAAPNIQKSVFKILSKS